MYIVKNVVDRFMKIQFCPLGEKINMKLCLSNALEALKNFHIYIPELKIYFLAYHLCIFFFKSSNSKSVHNP